MYVVTCVILLQWSSLLYGRNFPNFDEGGGLKVCEALGVVSCF